MILKHNLSRPMAVATLLLLGVEICLANPQEDAKVVADFAARVKSYADLRSKQSGASTRPTNSPEKLADSRQNVAGQVQAKRSDAAQGDIFTPEIAAYLKRQIATTLAGPEGRKVRASLRHAEPVHGLSLRVNQPYPEGVPLQSTPPGLLLNLPVLPKGLEYRFVGRTLVLLDTIPNVVVDLIPEAIPSTKD
jgi:hypothetical protein